MMRYSSKLLALWAVAFIYLCQAALLGIDFGSQFTKSCVLAPGLPFEMVLTSDSKRKDLSGLTLKSSPGVDGIERHYGNSAANLMTRFPSQSPFFYKSLLGQSLDPTSKLIKTYHDLVPGISLVPSANNRSTISFSILDDIYPIEELLSMNLIDIKNRANNMLPESSNKVKGVTITVPPFFDTHQRQAILDAVELSGLPFVSLVDSGTAALTNFVSKRQPKEDETAYFLLYDSGAGSTTATLASVTYEKENILVNIEGLGWEKDFGGQYLTAVIKNMLIDQLLEQNPSIKKHSLMSDARALSKLWKEAERAKIILSANGDVICRIESVYEDIDFKGFLKRSDFELALSIDTHRIKQPIEKALQRELIGSSALDWTNLEGIIYMGGSTRVPLIQKIIQEAYPEKVLRSINTDEAGVLGATLRGVSISKMFKSKNISVTERAVWNYSAKFSFSPEPVLIFPKGTPLGTKRSIVMNFTDFQDFQLLITENNKDISRYEASQISKITNGIIRDNYKNIRIKATFELTSSRLFQLAGLWIEGLPAKSASKTQSSSTSDIATESLTSSNETESTDVPTEAIISPFRKTIFPKVRYLAPKPMGISSKELSKSRINSLDKADHERKLKEVIRNDLEATLYRVKEIISGDVADFEDTTANLTLIQLVSDALDWLEYDGFHASTTQLNEKLSEAKKLLADNQPTKSVLKEHQEALDEISGRLEKLRARFQLHPEEDVRILKSIVSDLGTDASDLSLVESEAVKILETNLKERKTLENALDKAVNLSVEILGSLTDHDYDVEKYLGVLEKLIAETEKEEDNINLSKTKRLEDFRGLLSKLNANKNGKATNVQTSKAQENDEL
jgi:hypoxia up-regulated 1